MLMKVLERKKVCPLSSYATAEQSSAATMGVGGVCYEHQSKGLFLEIGCTFFCKHCLYEY